MRLHPPKSIVVEREVSQGLLMANLRERLPHVPVTVVDRIQNSPATDRDVLEVVAFRGRLLKSCPGTRHYHCCGYQILHFGVQCTLECTYCILQAYLNQNGLRLFGNVEQIFDALRIELHTHRETLYRIGTGEFTDSLLLDPWTGFSRYLVPLFAPEPNAVLELKTKTDFVSHLEGLDHGGHTIVGWSLNADSIQRREEPGAASLQERMDAARRVSRWGYHLAFHFDPLLDHPGWRGGYADTLDRLFDTVDPGRIVYISLGAFRFMPDLKTVIQRRHPRSRIIYGEFITGLDQKMRYFRDIRVELYAFMWERIRKAAPGVCVYLCMESEDIWKEALGFSPDEKGGLPRMLDDAVKTTMGVGAHCTRSCRCDRESVDAVPQEFSKEHQPTS